MLILLIGTIIGVTLAMWLYSSPTIKNQLKKWQRAILIVLRCISIIVLFLLLSNITLNLTKNEIQKPIIIVATDNSASVAMNADSAWIKNNFPQEINNLCNKLKSDFEVRQINFSDDVDENPTLNFKGESTNISSIFDYCNNKLFAQNIGALIIASDGITNHGADPIQKANTFTPPIYTIALGDTQPHPDLAIDKIIHNKNAHKSTHFPIVTYIKGDDIPEGNYTLTISQNGKKIDSAIVNITERFAYIKKVFYLHEEEIGLKQYNIKIDLPQNDINPQNNNATAIINIHDEAQEILILQNSWHPDVAAISQAIKKDSRYSLTISNINDFNGDISKYALIILHQLPSIKHNAKKIIEDAKKKNIAILVVIGQQTDINELQQHKLGINIKQQHKEYEDAYPKPNQDFQIFSTDFDLSENSNLPPLNVPYGEYGNIPSSQVVFYQQIGSIATKRPLIYFTQNGEQKVGVIAGEGIWRWRLQNYFKDENYNIDNELINKTIQYLCNNNKQERFVLNIGNTIAKHKSIVAEAVVYNKSNEPISNADVEITISDQNKQTYQTAFTSNQFGYTANLGKRETGLYTYIATATIGDEILTKKGQFIVIEETIEHNNLLANHNILNQLAIEHNGKMYYPQNLSQIYNDIKTNKLIKNKITTLQKSMYPVDFLQLAIIFILIICSEWFLRKFWGLM